MSTSNLKITRAKISLISQLNWSNVHDRNTKVSFIINPYFIVGKLFLGYIYILIN